MPSYKHYSTNKISIAGIIVHVPATATPYVLQDPARLGAAVDTAEKTGSSIADYVVPANREFHLFGVRVQHNAVAGSLKIYKSESAGATDDIILWINLPTHVGISEYYVNDLVISGDDKYITHDPSAANCELIQYIGYETDK